MSGQSSEGHGEEGPSSLKIWFMLSTQKIEMKIKVAEIFSSKPLHKV